MIIVKLLVAGKEQGAAVADSVLKNKFTLNVFGSPFDSYYMGTAPALSHTQVYVIQFVTKSLLFNALEKSLREEFPDTDFYICATPIVHMAINLHDKIRTKVIGTTGMETSFANTGPLQ